MALNTEGMCAMSQHKMPLCSMVPQRFMTFSLESRRGVLPSWSLQGAGANFCSMVPGFSTLPMRNSRFRAPRAHCWDCTYWSMHTPCMMPDWPFGSV